MVAGMKDAPPHVLAELLAPWSRIGAQRQAADAVFELGKSASGDRRITFARFLAEADQPARVVELTRQSATLPVTASNLAANALYGAALARTGRASDGLSRLDAVFALDAVNADALRGRADVRSRAGMHKLAIEDAEKAVAVDRTSAQTRLLLARIQRSAGDLDGAKRTLWNAFHDLPGERSIYEALRALVLRSEGMLAVQRLAKEFDDQRNNELMRSFA
jgi:tetratricopeptide (TPR) repeat protein